MLLPADFEQEILKLEKLLTELGATIETPHALYLTLRRDFHRSEAKRAAPTRDFLADDSSRTRRNDDPLNLSCCTDLASGTRMG
jgi:hypothetical protein